MAAAKKNSNKSDPAALTPDEDVSIPRLKLGEQGFVGLKTSNKAILEESNYAFRYPQFIRTVNEMRNSPTVGAAMNVYRMMISRVEWYVEPPVGATDIEKERAKYIESCMHDMEGSWSNFIESVVPYLEYGFSVHEIVLRRRLRKTGSKFNDGLVGIKKLASRNQDTITGWEFSEDGADLLRIEQSLTNIENAYKFQKRTDESGKILIDREKFLLFTASGNKGNPQGNSIYKAIYLAYKQMSLLQDNELVGVAKDIQGILKIAIPPKYLDPNASAADKAAVASFQSIIDNYNAGTQRGLLVPNMIDLDSKLPLFTYELMESKGGSKYDVEKIIQRLQGDILSALSVDILKLGANGTGSFSLAESKSSVLAMAIDYRLREMAEVLNQHLMRTLYEQNGWNCENLPKFAYKEIEDVDLETFSKAVQRIFSTSAIEVDREVMNRIRESIGVQALGDDVEVDTSKLPSVLSGTSSRAGDGMAVGTTGNGTSKGVGSGQNTSDNNNDNTG